MASLFTLSLATLLSVTSALPQASSEFPPHVPAGPNDVRSPCPALNSLANHGFLPHSGRGMTLPIITKGLADGLNIAPDFSKTLWAGGLLSSPNPAGLSFDLDNLVRHNFPIEHDASLSRVDAFFGDQQPFNEEIWTQFTSFFEGQTIATIPTTSEAKYSRVTDSRDRNPTFQYGAREFILSYGEAALFLSTMGNPTTGDAPLNFVNVFFREERLPYDEGWRKPADQTSLQSLGDMIWRLYAASPEPLPEGLEVITMGALRRALEGRDPITGLLANATCPSLGC